MKNRSVALIGFKPLEDREGFSALSSCVGTMGEPLKVDLNLDEFYLGSLNSMMMNLDELSKMELQCEVFQKKIEKIYLEVADDDAPLNTKKIGDGSQMEKGLHDYLKTFDWDAFRFSRSGNIIQPIRNKMLGLENSLKSKYLEYSEAKNALVAFGDDSGETASLYTINLNDLLSQLSSDQNRSFDEVFFFEGYLGERSRYLKDYVVFVPERETQRFKKEYEEMEETIVADSLTYLGKRGDYSVMRLVYFRELSDSFPVRIKKQFKAVGRDFRYDKELAMRRVKQKQSSKLFLENVAMNGWLGRFFKGISDDLPALFKAIGLDIVEIF